MCVGVKLPCTADQNGFLNSCGCGCTDKGPITCQPPEDPTIHYISRDPSQCSDAPPPCATDKIGFSNACGCGCLDR